MNYMGEGECKCTCTPCKNGQHLFCNFRCNDANWRDFPPEYKHLYHLIPDQYKDLPIYSWCDDQDENEWICVGPNEELSHVVGWQRTRL